MHDFDFDFWSTDTILSRPYIHMIPIAKFPFSRGPISYLAIIING